MLVHKNISLYGEVQGVFLRRTIQREAQHRGVYGLIKNQSDGSVYIEAEAKEDILKEFIAWLHGGAGEGPHHIARVEVDEGAFGALDSFEIQN